MAIKKINNKKDGLEHMFASERIIVFPGERTSYYMRIYGKEDTYIDSKIPLRRYNELKQIGIFCFDPSEEE
jgi:hypothetical protein